MSSFCDRPVLRIDDKIEQDAQQMEIYKYTSSNYRYFAAINLLAST